MRDGLSSEREWTQIIRGEFLEIPGLRLTKAQIQQLWGLRADACTTVLEALLSQRFLQLTADGRYVHGSIGGTHPRVRQVWPFTGKWPSAGTDADPAEAVMRQTPDPALHERTNGILVS